MTIKTAKTNYFRLFICDELPNVVDATDWVTNMDNISSSVGVTLLATRLKAVNAVQFDQIAGIGLQKDPSLIADPSGGQGNRGIPALKINCSFKVIDPTNTEFTYILSLPNTRKVAVLVDIQNKLYTAANKLKFKIKSSQVGNAVEDIEISGELADGGSYDDNWKRYKTTFPTFAP